MQSTRKGLISTLAILAGALVVAGCTNRGAPAASRSARTDAVVICMSEEPASLYRIHSRAAVTLQALVPSDPQGWRHGRGYGYETLMLEGGEFPTLENGGAQLRGAGENAILSVTFRFRQDIRWSDGEPFTVDDLLFTRRVILDPMSGAAERGSLAQQTFEKIDGHTLRVTYPSGVVDPLYFLPPLSTANGLSAPLPEHALRGLTPAEILESDYARLPDPVLGPYEFVEWEEGDHITLRAVDNWWGGPVHIPVAALRFVPDTSQLVAMTESGACDVAAGGGLQIAGLPLIQQAAGQGVLAYAAVPSLAWERIDMNTYPAGESAEGLIPFFADLRVRQAVAYGTNRAGMAEQILYGLVEPMTSLVPGDHWAWNPETADLYLYDPEQAKILLAQAGWEDRDRDGIREASRDLSGEYACGRGAWRIPAGAPFEVKLRVPGGDPVRGQIATAFQRDMAQIGIRIRLDLMPSAPRFGEGSPLSGQPIQIGLVTSAGETDPGAWLNAELSSLNINRTAEGESANADRLRQQRGEMAGWCDPQAAQLLLEAGSAFGREERAQSLAAFQRIFGEQVPSLPLFQRVELFAWAPNLCGPDLGPANTSEVAWNLAEWRWLAPGMQCEGGG